MTEFKSYLAEELVASRNTVSYRLLARTLKVHVNAAKCMLYEYHEAQNKRKPGSVYATYMLAGTKKQAPQPNGKEVDVDASMRSSPPASSVVQSSQQRGEDINVKTVTLVREENLDGRSTRDQPAARVLTRCRREEHLRNHNLHPHLQPLPHQTP